MRMTVGHHYIYQHLNWIWRRNGLTVSTVTTCLLSSPSLLLLLGCLCLFMLPYQVSQVSHIFICLLQQVGQASVFLLINQLTVAFFIFSLVTQEMSVMREMTVNTHPSTPLSMIKWYLRSSWSAQKGSYMGEELFGWSGPESHRFVSIGHSIIGVGRDFEDYLVQVPLPWVGISSTRPRCSKPHPTWPLTLLGLGHPQLFWATHSSVSPLSQQSISS